MRLDTSAIVRFLGFGSPPKVTPRELGRGLVLMVVYFLASKLGLSLAVINASSSAVWPSTGIAFVAILLSRYRAWPCIFVGAFLANITTSGMVLPSIGISL